MTGVSRAAAKALARDSKKVEAKDMQADLKELVKLLKEKDAKLTSVILKSCKNGRINLLRKTKYKPGLPANMWSFKNMTLTLYKKALTAMCPSKFNPHLVAKIAKKNKNMPKMLFSVALDEDGGTPVIDTYEANFLRRLYKTHQARGARLDSVKVAENGEVDMNVNGFYRMTPCEDDDTKSCFVHRFKNKKALWTLPSSSASSLQLASPSSSFLFPTFSLIRLRAQGLRIVFVFWCLALGRTELHERHILHT